MPNFSQLNSGILNQGIAASETGEGLLVSFEQTVEFFASGSGLIASIEQEVATAAGGQIVSFIQSVINLDSSFYQRNGWDLELYINGLAIPANQISGAIKISRTEDDAASMEFQLLPPAGVINLGLYEGKSVVCNIRTADGLLRAYTGRINIPDIDINERKINIFCSDNRRELINTSLAGVVPGVGYYDENVFGVANDLADELDNRLTTIPYTLNFDSYGQVRLSSSFAAASANFTFEEADVYREQGRDPRVIITPRSKIVNTVNIDYEYRYQRLWHKVAQYSWDSDYASTPCSFMVAGYSVASRAMIEAAIDSAGWPREGEVDYVPVLAAGLYNCPSGGEVIPVAVSWTQTQYTTVPQTERYRDPGGEGGFSTRNVVDSEGQQVYTSVPTSSIDVSGQLCFGAFWAATTRFAQTITEKYSVSVVAPQSVTRFGSVIQSESSGIDSLLDSSAWENYKSYQDPPAGFTINTSGPSGSYYINEPNNYTNYVNGLNTLIHKAKTTILKSHRDNRVIFNTFVKPEVELHHTVILDAVNHEGTSVYAKGKVYSITHTLRPDNGDCNTQIELVLSITEGSQAETDLSLPTRPSNIPPVSSDGFNLGSHYGEDPSTHPEWTGFIGNRFITEREVGGYTNYFKTSYPESFVVDTPAIDPVYRDNLILTGSKTYNVALIDDTLTVEFP